MDAVLEIAPPARKLQTLEQLLSELGDIPPFRICLFVPPGTATEDDVIPCEKHTGKLVELVDGVLVEKGMGYNESLIAVRLVSHLYFFASGLKLGLVAGADGTLRLMPGLVRIPDVSFVSWGRLPGGVKPDQPIPNLVPDLAVEVLSKSNTKPEMARKNREYFEVGVRLVWHIDPETRSAVAFTSPENLTVIDPDGTLDGGDVLPGFRLKLTRLFD